MSGIEITKAETSRMGGVNWDKLGFGLYFSDHMFVADYKDGKWGDERIEPYAPMPIEPGLCTLHYGQSIFEGLKAFRAVDGSINLFRPDMNVKRLNYSASQVCIPEYDEAKLLDAIAELVRTDEKWIPKNRGESLYIRPVVYGSSNFLGVHASNEYRLIVMTSPVGSYYPTGLDPVKIMVADKHVRAARLGVGSAKTAANYAASLKGGTEAKQKGYAQVLWLDAVTRKNIDEVGAMNIMFVIGDELITPSLDSGTILAGITRYSVLDIARESGMKVSERTISIDELLEAHASGDLKEAFGTGTAAVISPVGLLAYQDKEYIINNSEIGPIAQKFYDEITGIQYGEIEDVHGWIKKV
jgi:branched-chain amino acid aminotransferase